MSNDTQTDATANQAPAADTSATAAQPATLLTAPPADATAAPAADTTQSGATEAKPGEQPPADQKADDKPQGAPDTYADFTAPEGVKFNDEAMTEFKAFAKENGLSQEAAQKAVDMGVKMQQQTMTAVVDKVKQSQAQWAADSAVDKEFGGDKLAENMAIANKAVAAFASPELITMLKESGLGNHPELVRAFYRVGKAISEDRLVTGEHRQDNGRTPGQNLYDKSGMNP